MKSIHKNILPFILCTFMVVGFSSIASAQAKPAKGMEQTVSFMVYGVCEDCKARIESAAIDSKGVKKAEWDKQSNVLVIVGSDKMDKQKVANNIAKAGYKSELASADPKGYAKLPACCQYDTGIEKH
jgi:hypothetical protein